MATKKKCGVKKHKTKSKSQRKNKSNNKNINNIQKGGRTVVNKPSIKYTKGSAPSKKLECIKCKGSTFIVKTLTMGTKAKAFFNAELLDNRYKVFTCNKCGFVQLYSNEITCSGKKCDPMF